MDSALFETLGSGVLRRCSTQHWGSALGFWMGRLLLAAVRPVLGKRGGWAFDGCRGTLRGGSWKLRALRSRRLKVILRECPRGRPSRPGEASTSNGRVPFDAVRPRPGGAQGMAPPRSWASEYYHTHTEELSKGSALYLCCRICFEGKCRPTSEDLESSRRPENQYPGCIRYSWRSGKSPAGLAAHLRRHDMEDPARVHHDQLSESLGEGGDKDTTWDFVRDMVVLDLADFASAERKGATRVYHKHLRRPLFGRKKIKDVFDDFAAAGMKKVVSIVAARKKSGGRFAMPTDAWVSRGLAEG